MMRNNAAMGTLSRGTGAVLAITILGLLAAASPAGAADTIRADVDCCTFAPGPYFQDLGEIPLFENPPGANPHNVTSTATGPDGDALFRSQTIGADDTSPVEGTQYLEAGTYPFYCTLHGASMSGDLVIEDGKGAVVPRPSVKVAIPSQRLKKVRRSGKVKVKVRAITASNGVRVKVKRGKKVIASASVSSLNAGASRVLKLKINRKGRKAIRNGRKVGLSAKATVAFGKPSQAKRSLR
jgi:plastocyanin